MGKILLTMALTTNDSNCSLLYQLCHIFILVYALAFNIFELFTKIVEFCAVAVYSCPHVHVNNNEKYEIEISSYVSNYLLMCTVMHIWNVEKWKQDEIK